MPDKSIRRATEHPAWPIFARSPDGNTTSMRWRSAITAHAVLWGGGFAEIVSAIDKSRRFLFLLDPAATSVQVSPDGVVHYQTSGGTLDASRVVHFAGLSHDGITGHPLVKLARQAIGLGLAAEQFGGAYLGGGTNAAGWFKPPNEIRKEAKDEFLDGVSEEHGGPEKAGKYGILPVGWDFVETNGGANPESAQLLDLRQFSVLDVARLLNVPPHKLADKSGESYASIEASNLDFVQSCLVPWAESFEQSLNLRLLTDEEVAAGYEFRHSFAALLRGDTAARTALNTALFDRGCLQPDQWLISEGLPPLNTPGSRSTYMPLNMAPSDQKDADGE